MQYHKVFHALGDEHRLMMLKRLASGKPQTLSTISEGLDMSRQGARKHIQVLEDVGLIIVEEKGRSTIIKMNTKPLEDSSAFLKRLETEWEQRLQSLKKYLEGK